jgi:hypothetical protein
MLDIRLKTIRLISFSVFLILCLTFSCEKIQSTPELKKHFSNKQVKDLQRINSFFISEVLKNKSFKEGVENYYEKLYSIGFDSILKTIDYNNQKKLYEKISQETFENIWTVQTDTSQFIGEKYITPKYKGAFYNYLEELALNNEFGKAYFKKVESSGDYTGLIVDYFIAENFHTMNFEDFNNQIIISICFLTMIDDYERDPNRKQRIQNYQEKVKKQFRN